MSFPIWRTEWLIARRRRRLMVLNTLIPLLLVTPIAYSAAPAAHAAATFAVLFTLFGTFGSSIPLIRDGESGLLGRLGVAGVSPGGFLLQRVAATATLDLCQLAPSAAVIALGRGASSSDLLALAASATLGLFAANLLGAFTAAVARSVAEGALFAAVSALLLLHLSGTFRPPVPGTWQATVEGWMPFRPLHQSLLALAAPSSSSGAHSHLLPPVVAIFGILAFTGMVGRALMQPGLRR